MSLIMVVTELIFFRWELWK